MGWKYFQFRSLYELKRRIGHLKKRFPINPPHIMSISLADWRECSEPFFFQSRRKLPNFKNPNRLLKDSVEKIFNGEICFFNAKWYKLGKEYDWITNPLTDYKYDINKHWSTIDDLSKEAGDIKFVWEKSRFSFLYDVIRYDYHFEKDNSTFVFDTITDWIDKNPINQGPNYKCSQEISLRVLNWIFALYFYKESINLNNDIFDKIINSIYWQIHHVYNNINFSRISVRNNHAITETLTLYIVGMLFPKFPNANKWKAIGKKWFEEEIKYQIADDGTYLQFSMNYHRVVIQLLTWAISLADINKEKFANYVYERAYQSVNFLFQCQDEITGHLPNYGANDGALFFKLNDAEYRDYRPQLDVLHFLLTNKNLYDTKHEDSWWYSTDKTIKARFQAITKQQGFVEFKSGGYVIIREKNTFSFIRCGKYKNRPGQADNLHLDIWHNGENLLMDAGSYMYNTNMELLKYFNGSESHNTVMIEHYDQMQKGPRFIWLNWSQAISENCKETDDCYIFEGKVACFTYLDKSIIHRRTIIKEKGKLVWHINDEINKPTNMKIRQIWHYLSNKVGFESQNIRQDSIGLYSSLYGIKEKSKQTTFISKNCHINTTISIVEK